MFRFSRFTRTVPFSVILLMLTTGLAFAGTGSTSVGGGTLSWTYTTQTSNCWTGVLTPFTQTNFSAFSYVDSHGAHFSLNGGGVYFQSPGGSSCPPPGFQPPAGVPMSFTSSGTNFTITFIGQSGGGGNATIATTGYNGYINPKYMIVGVTYAPPGPSSSVNYTNSTTVSTTNTVSNSFTNAFMSSLTTSASAGLLGWKSGVSATISAGYSQTSTSTNSLELDETVSRSYSTSGAANPYVGLNHDYDIVWLWLNPVELFTVNTNASGAMTSITWNGHGVSTLDQPVADIYPVYVGWLNGDIPMTPSQAAPLQRAWAGSSVITWPASKGPAITGPGPGTDFDSIKKADPYWSCTPTPSTCPTTVDLTRYTLTANNPDFLYLQAPVGGTPITQTYTDSYTTISTMARGGTYETMVGFGFEKTFGGSFFIADFKTTLKVSDTISLKHTWDHKLATTNSSTAALSITGPPCVVVGNTCNPLYSGSTQFDLYEDSLFATFYLNPVN